MKPTIRNTRGGFRISQNGVVISESRNRPGPTHSVFDILAALVHLLHPGGPIGVLGFAGGGMMAPLRAIGCSQPIHTVDLDPQGHRLFIQRCSGWAGIVEWTEADAVAWLRGQRDRFGVLVEDLSLPSADDVLKPDVSWTGLPDLIRRRLSRDGRAIFNLLPLPGDLWPSGYGRVGSAFPQGLVVEFQEFENRIFIGGGSLPTPRVLSARLGAALRRLGSLQAGKVSVSRFGG